VAAAKNVLGGFEHEVLLAMLHLGKDAYTAAIVLELEQRIGRDVAAAAVYMALRRLEENGLVDSVLRESEGRGGRRERRHFEVKSEALDLLRESKWRLMQLWDGLPALGASEERR